MDAIHILLKADSITSDGLIALKTMLQQYPGESPLYFHVERAEGSIDRSQERSFSSRLNDPNYVPAQDRPLIVRSKNVRLGLTNEAQLTAIRNLPIVQAVASRAADFVDLAQLKGLFSPSPELTPRQSQSSNAGQANLQGTELTPPPASAPKKSPAKPRKRSNTKKLVIPQTPAEIETKILEIFTGEMDTALVPRA